MLTPSGRFEPGAKICLRWAPQPQPQLYLERPAAACACARCSQEGLLTPPPPARPPPSLQHV
jgi:hypothetical protein